MLSADRGNQRRPYPPLHTWWLALEWPRFRSLSCLGRVLLWPRLWSSYWSRDSWWHLYWWQTEGGMMYYTIAWVCCIIKLLNSNDLFQGKKGESGLNVLTVSSSLFRGNGRVIYLPRSCRRSTCVGVLQVKWSLETLDFEERLKAVFPEKWSTECVAALK